MQSQIIFTDMFGQNTIVGSNFRADGWYGRFSHMYTVAINFSNFTGSLHIQATLAEDPADEDFFDVVPVITQGNSSQIVNFTGNFSWIRANVTKTMGSIDMIMLNQGL